jgi:Na+-transporting NADH:ubiquinone oxidoreductase subunit NqrE
MGMGSQGGLVLTSDELRVLHLVLDKIITHPKLSESIYAGLTETDTALIASMAEMVRKEWNQIENVQRMFGAKQ